MVTKVVLKGVSYRNVAGYLIEERRRWPIITASPRGQCSKQNSELHDIIIIFYLLGLLR